MCQTRRGDAAQLGLEVADRLLQAGPGSHALDPDSLAMPSLGGCRDSNALSGCAWDELPVGSTELYEVVRLRDAARLGP